MGSGKIRRSFCGALFAFFFVLVALPVSLYGSSPTTDLDYGLDLFEDSRYKNSETALLSLLSASSFRRLDSSQRTLVYTHIAYSKINRGKEKESIPYLDKALSLAKREFGQRSLPYVAHLRTKALAHYWSDNRRKAVRIGETMIDTWRRASCPWI